MDALAYLKQYEVNAVPRMCYDDSECVFKNLVDECTYSEFDNPTDAANYLANIAPDTIINVEIHITTTDVFAWSVRNKLGNTYHIDCASGYPSFVLNMYRKGPSPIRPFMHAFNLLVVASECDSREKNVVYAQSWCGKHKYKIIKSMSEGAYIRFLNEAIRAIDDYMSNPTNLYQLFNGNITAVDKTLFNMYVAEHWNTSCTIKIWSGPLRIL